MSSWRWLIRRIVQGLVLALLIAIPLLALAKIELLYGTLCSIGTPSVYITCPLGAIQTTLASREIFWPLILSSSALVVLALASGRVFCGWICPQYALSEVGDNARSIIGFNKNPKPDSPARSRKGRIILFSILGLGLLGSAVLQIPILCYICPIGIICRTIVNLTYGSQVGVEIVVLLSILAAEIFIARRGWCKYLCPVGALYSLCTTKRSLRIERTSELCISCHHCEQVCPMGNSPLQDQITQTCTNCAVCVDTCSTEALKFKWGEGEKSKPSVDRLAQ